MARPAALAAFGAVLFQIAAVIVQVPALRDAPNRDDDDTRYRESLLNVNEFGDRLLVSTFLTAVASALTVGVLFYLFRAARHRRPQVPARLDWLFFAVPVLVLVGPVLVQLNVQDLADRFLESGARTNDRARNLIEDNPDVLGLSLSTTGALGVAIAFVLAGLQAMRAGLLTGFLGVLGIVAGVLMVLPLVGLPIVQVFWLVAVGLVLLDKWPGGRGPAWESGKPDPWPRAGRRGLGAPREEEAAAEQAPLEPERVPEPVPERPSSRKRKRKRR